MSDKSIVEKLQSNTPFALVLGGAFLVLVAAAGGFPRLSLQVDELEWRITLAILGVVFAGAGLLVWWREKGAVNVSQKTPASKKFGALLEKIEFDYRDSPTEHGWRIVDCSDETHLVITHFEDGFVGNAVEIKSTVWYAMDYAVNPVALFGSLVEFVAKLENRNSIVYARSSVQSSDGSTSKTVWLSFPVGNEQPSPHGDGSAEWRFPIEPALLHSEGRWLRFQIDLNEAVTKTYGKAGWRFGQLKGFRLRGNLSLAHIFVFKAK